MSDQEEIVVDGVEGLTIRVWQVGDNEWGSNFVVGLHHAAIREGYPTGEAAAVGAAKAAKTKYESELNETEDSSLAADLMKRIVAIDNFLANFDQSNNDVQVADEDEECTDPVKMAATMKALREELREAELVAYDAQKAAKAAKANVEALHERLKEAIDSFFPKKEFFPLFDDQDGEITQPDLPLEPEEAWKSRDVAELSEFGVSKGILVKLREQEVKTFGQLEAHRVKHPDMTGYPGIGPARAEELLNGLLAWLDKNRDAAAIADVKGGE
jgi:hypothetical protein